MDNHEDKMPPGVIDEMKEGNSTTHDITEDAEEALKRYEAEQQNKRNELGYLPIEGENATLSIEVQSSISPLVITVDDEVTLGRRDPATQDAPEIDLTPYGAYQLGISRRHAVIRLRNKRLEIFDLGSRNGTYLNGKRLAPHQPTPIPNGAALRLGKLELKIYIKT